MKDKPLKIKDRVRITADWVVQQVGDDQIATIENFQTNQGISFAQVRWAKNHHKMSEEFGTLFALDELHKI